MDPLEGEAVAAQTKESRVTIPRDVHRGEQLMQRMNAAVLMTSGSVLMLHCELNASVA